MEGAESSAYVNKQRTLLVCSRGIGARERHLMGDLMDLLPHGKKDIKLDVKKDLKLINDLADMKNCNNTIYFEERNHSDLYMWVSKTPKGPSIKFQVHNVHTMKELKLTGNCLKGSRPILSFDATFETLPEWKLMKEVLIQALGSPKAHPKAKPFIDHVFSFSVADGKIWFRNYQIVFDADSSASVKTAKKADPVLVEIGPRFVLTPVKILSGSFSGVTLYENEKAVSPAASRASIKRARADEFAKRVLAKGAKKQKVLESELPVNELDDVFAGEFEE